MNIFSSNWAVPSWLTVPAIGRFSPLPGWISFSRWTWKTTRVLYFSEEYCHSRSSYLWKEYRKFKLCLQEITLYFSEICINSEKAKILSSAINSLVWAETPLTKLYCFLHLSLYRTVHYVCLPLGNLKMLIFQAVECYSKVSDQNNETGNGIE